MPYRSSYNDNTKNKVFYALIYGRGKQNLLLGNPFWQLSNIVCSRIIFVTPTFIPNVKYQEKIKACRKVSSAVFLLINHLQRHILTKKHLISNEFHSLLRGKTSGDQKLQFVLPAEDTPAETEQSQNPPPIDHGDVLFFNGKENNELESNDIEVNIYIHLCRWSHDITTIRTIV